MNHTIEYGEPFSDRKAHFSGGVYAGEFRLKAGCLMVSHKHRYDHMSILASGTALVKTNEGEQTMTGPCVIEIKAGINHAIYALTEIAWFCIHAVDTASEAYEAQDQDEIEGLLIVKEARA